MLIANYWIYLQLQRDAYTSLSAARVVEVDLVEHLVEFRGDDDSLCLICYNVEELSHSGTY